MNIHEAYVKGLIKIGRRIITNGNCNTTGNGVGEEIRIKGTINYVGYSHFCIAGEYLNISNNKKRKATSWGINYSNTAAYIEFIENTKKISPYTYWLIQNNL